MQHGPRQTPATRAVAQCKNGTVLWFREKLTCKQAGVRPTAKIRHLHAHTSVTILQPQTVVGIHAPRRWWPAATASGWCIRGRPLPPRFACHPPPSAADCGRTTPRPRRPSATGRASRQERRRRGRCLARHLPRHHGRHPKNPCQAKAGWMYQRHGGRHNTRSPGLAQLEPHYWHAALHQHQYYLNTAQTVTFTPSNMPQRIQVRCTRTNRQWASMHVHPVQSLLALGLATHPNHPRGDTHESHPCPPPHRSPPDCLVPARRDVPHHQIQQHGHCLSCRGQRHARMLLRAGARCRTATAKPQLHLQLDVGDQRLLTWQQGPAAGTGSHQQQQHRSSSRITTGTGHRALGLQ